jgi:nucleoside-diphosphate-sugar epimerase
MSPTLITGATGFLGRHVISRAAERGIEVVASEGDLRDPDAVRTLMRRVRPEAVVHLAAGRRNTLVIEDEVRMACNVVAEAHGTTVLVAGSAAQYGMASDRPVTEDAATAPLTVYGEAKCAIERAVTALPGARVICARSFNILGPGQGLDAPIPSWAAQLAEGAATLRTGNVDVVRDFLDARDIADAFLDLVAAGITGAVNVGSGVPVKLRAVLDALIDQLGDAVAVEPDPALFRPQDPPYVVADVARLRSATGFAPRFSLRDSLADVLAEWRERSASGAR